MIQQYVRAPVPLITCAEFVGGRFLYAVEVDISDGFKLCPADACAVGEAFCPAAAEPRAKFTIIDDIDAVLRHRYEAFLAHKLSRRAMMRGPTRNYRPFPTHDS